LRTNPTLFKLSILLCLSSTLTAQTGNWEFNYLLNRENNRTTGKTSFYNGISASAYILGVAAPASYLIAGLVKNDNTLKKTALYITESIVIAQVISFSTKAIVNRDRPGIKYENLLNPVNNAKNASFPSGHAALAFSIATSLTMANPKWYVALPSYTWAGLVGYSRVYLGVHYPTDVLAGAVVGAGSAWLSCKLNKWMHKSKTIKPKTIPG
jgi:undecaprenyl-diphosphatase